MVKETIIIKKEEEILTRGRNEELNLLITTLQCVRSTAALQQLAQDISLKQSFFKFLLLTSWAYSHSLNDH